MAILSSLTVLLFNTIELHFSSIVIIEIIALILLLILSALISASETAFFSINPNQISENKHLSNKYKKVLQLLHNPHRLLATILITNNFVNISIVILATFLTNQLFNFSENSLIAFIVDVVVITSGILLFGEILPKIYSSQNTLGFARFMVLPLKILIKILYPFSSLLLQSTRLIQRRMKNKKNISISELSHAIDITQNGEISDEQEEERKILKGIVTFGETNVKEIMRPRIDVASIEENSSFSDVLSFIRESGFSRIPVYKESFDQVIGILYIKDILPHIDNEDFKWQNLIRPPYFVPETKKIDDLLKEFQDKKIHMAIVVDEYGGTSGIVTLEDILEEIVGEINDEFDSESESVSFLKHDDATYTFEGKTSLNDFCKIQEINTDYFDDIKGESETLAGLILELNGNIPPRNQKIQVKDFIFNVESSDIRRIKRVKATRIPKNE